MQYLWLIWGYLTLDVLSQCAVFLGAAAVLFLGKGSRWGFVLGLLAQPAWLYTSVTHQQWGVAAASVLYTIGWSVGVYRTFIKKSPPP